MNNPYMRMSEAYMQLWQDAFAYTVDSAQRNLLYADAMRQRGNLFVEHGLQGKPPLIKFAHELVLDGAKFERPCNYSLLRVLPDAKFPVDPAKRPIVICDPRAGHGPGVGGFKPDSQVGMALRARHPVYFVSFAPHPIPGQTLGDVGAAEALFIEEVRARHPACDKPAVIGNCQAGWAIAALAAVRPEIMGPILLNGAPLSYWAGSDGKNPMRYAGAKVGGSWVSSMLADMGAGEFDGSLLVRNFESLNPANTYWTKQYNLYANIDTELDRYLDFERWWGGYFRMTGEEIESIVDNLFVGNKLARGLIQVGEQIVDLKNITSPIVIFASDGDDITPPAQALDWIIDVWGDERAIVEAGRIIVYMVHENIGHLGIFVGGGVARKEHDQIVNTLDEIERLPPGLYEMTMEAKSSALKYDSLSYGNYSVKFKPRTMDDLRAFDPDGRDDELLFSSIAKVSDVNAAFYRTFVRPVVRALVSAPTAEVMRSLNPDRMSRVLASDINPVMKSLAIVAQRIRDNRAVVDPRNPFVRLERRNSRMIEAALDRWKSDRNEMTQQWAKWMYGPFALGASFPPDAPMEQEARELAELQMMAAAEELRPRIDAGGFPEGLARMLLIAVRDKGSIRRRSLRLAHIAGEVTDAMIAGGKLKRIKKAVDWAEVRAEQAKLLALFPEEAVAALPKLLSNPAERKLACAMVGRIMLVDPEVTDPHSALVLRAQELLGTDFEVAAANDDLPEELQAIALMQSA
jgi:pimeloyl-ACP methyl ester carboxylesterase